MSQQTCFLCGAPVELARYTPLTGRGSFLELEELVDVGTFDPHWTTCPRSLCVAQPSEERR